MFFEKTNYNLNFEHTVAQIFVFVTLLLETLLKSIRAGETRGGQEGHLPTNDYGFTN